MPASKRAERQYQALTVAELRQEARRRGVAGYSRLRKRDLVRALEAETADGPRERPARERRPASAPGLAGFDGAFLADLLSQFLAHERAGSRLYRVASARTLSPTLRRQYEEFGRETQNHARILERLITGLGGEPAYVSPAARATERQGAELLEASLPDGSGDDLTMELALLEAVVLAETKDQANWSLLRALCDRLPDSDARRSLQAAVDQVGPEEDKHVTWARSTWHGLIMSKAGSGSDLALPAR